LLCHLDFEGNETDMNLRRAGLLGMAVSFARSERGQRMIREARTKYDTPANRAKARDLLSRKQSPQPRR
jgi:hypothetical protein